MVGVPTSAATAAAAAAAATASSSLPRMGLGMAALGRPGYINLGRSESLGSPSDRDVGAMQDRANTVMEAMASLSSSPSGDSDGDSIQGRRPWFDCARSYGLSERFVGEFLRERRADIDPGDVYVSSKWGYTYVADWKVELDEGRPHEVKDHSVEVCTALSSLPCAL